MRMSLPSASRQPCSVGSCMVVTRNRPSGLNVTSRCEPFQSSISGAACGVRETRASRRCNARSRGASPSAQTRARRRSRAGRATSPRPWRCARRPACRPTTRPRHRGRARRGRSSGVWHRRERSRFRPSASVATTLPSSPPVRMRAPSLATARMPPACTAMRCALAVRRGEQQRFLAEHEHGAVGRGNARATTGAPCDRPVRRRAPVDGGDVGSRVAHGHCASRCSAPRSSRSPCGSSPRAGCGR